MKVMKLKPAIGLLFTFTMGWSVSVQGVVHHLAAPVIATESAAQALEQKKQATRLIQQIQNQQSQRKRQMDNILNNNDNNHCPAGESCPPSSP